MVIKEFDSEAPRLIFDDIADLISERMKTESAADIGKKFNRERKAVYAMRDGCGFHCNVDFICGLNRLGYDLRLVEIGQELQEESQASRAKMSKKLYLNLLETVKEDIPVEQDIIQMRDTFEEAANDLNQIACTMELLLACLYEAEETPHREALSLLWRNLLVIRDRMSNACMDSDVWSAAYKAQKRLAGFTDLLQCERVGA